MSLVIHRPGRHITAVTRHGINRVDTGCLQVRPTWGVGGGRAVDTSEWRGGAQRASFEETCEILLEAAAYGMHVPM